jgi:nicotinamide riboside transporter PnuC
MIQIIGLLAGILGIAGVLLNNRKLIGCFPIWIASNALSGGLHVYAGLWTLALRDLVFLCLAVDGWRRWRRDRPQGLVWNREIGPPSLRRDRWGDRR